MKGCVLDEYEEVAFLYSRHSSGRSPSYRPRGHREEDEEDKEREGAAHAQDAVHRYLTRVQANVQGPGRDGG